MVREGAIGGGVSHHNSSHATFNAFWRQTAQILHDKFQLYLWVKLLLKCVNRVCFSSTRIEIVFSIFFMDTISTQPFLFFLRNRNWFWKNFNSEFTGRKKLFLLMPPDAKESKLHLNGVLQMFWRLSAFLVFLFIKYKRFICYIFNLRLPPIFISISPHSMICACCNKG